VFEESVVERDEDGAPRDVTRAHAQWRAVVHQKIGSTSRTVSEMHVLEQEKFGEILRALERVERICRGIQGAPARRLVDADETQGTRRLDLTNVRRGNPNQGQDTRPATLFRNPRNLVVLWDEYVNGVGGSKPAKDFNDLERGRCSSLYSQRNVYWQCMTRLLAHGLTLESGIARISEIYPGSVTQKIIALRRDENNGGHNRLFPFPVQATRRRRGRNSAPRARNVRRRTR
jgi:hypothetical protein